ncbi:carboxymuconolactone decarboxylase family protein [Minwuia thermotolerans]|uniref:Carboxymuconolactone decarboxylase n=1 Tax=Minwuia thermotolerans TaxID=2056226 RepID=A0A2M9FX95_9PROT|nr:carboxymuconolactone decarboxylase family protein [Minwuia thermotolerans]PJK28074.1 carboxymuconolactone decarboxylase [Minwuia thermotolerans]
MSNPLAPVARPYAPEVADLLSRYPQRDGYVLKLFRSFANSTRFLRKGVANLLDPESPLPMRQREIVILRVTANLRCEYEWGVHVAAFGSHVGFAEAQVRATAGEGGSADCWEDATERLLLDVVDDICREGAPAPARRESFRAAWNAEQQLEILALCGNYHTISFVAKTAELEPEDFAARFPG